jgi:hypothetical protein
VWATRRNNPEDTNLHSHRRENLKSYTEMKCLQKPISPEPYMTLANFLNQPVSENTSFINCSYLISYVAQEQLTKVK